MKTFLIFIFGLVLGILGYFGYIQYQKTIPDPINFPPLGENPVESMHNNPQTPVTEKKTEEIKNTSKDKNISVNSKTVEIKDFDVTCPSGWSKSRHIGMRNIPALSCSMLISGQQAFDDGIIIEFFIIADSEWIKHVGSHFQYYLQQKNSVLKDIGLFHGVESYSPGTVGINPVFVGFKKVENSWVVVEAKKAGETIRYDKYELFLKDIVNSFVAL